MKRYAILLMSAVLAAQEPTRPPAPEPITAEERLNVALMQRDALSLRAQADILDARSRDLVSAMERRCAARGFDIQTLSCARPAPTPPPPPKKPEAKK